MIEIYDQGPVKPRVFAVHKSRDVSFKNAEKFGSVVTVFDGFVDLGQDDQNMEKAKTALKDFRFDENDYVLLSGAKILNAIITLAALETIQEKNRAGTHLKILTYSVEEDRYIEHSFNLQIKED